MNIVSPHLLPPQDRRPLQKCIKDEHVQIVGIYGITGVGKTTLTGEVAASMSNIFVDVVFIIVSQNMYGEKIQNKVEVAVKQIINGEKVLMILDESKYLSKDEAWILLTQVVGKKVETDAKLKKIETDVMEECGGLPLLIQVVGNALNNLKIMTHGISLSR
ncbi:hypothetical protein OSB04_001164 [Centaurea solstitialis]|uniref:NB-ARC domain-containing protein n=1 Tax=Centaurea solstitialis TaxID=347529 RepID=A0AA38TQH2_9ASTR|nr:hypothetical protein OSB04_001164 [Centaurea solstitialis]